MSNKKHSASWVIINRESGAVICEVFNKKCRDMLMTDKYKAVPILEYLVEFNANVKREAL